MIKHIPKCLTIFGTCSLLSLTAIAQEDRPEFNDKRVPESLDDIIAIEKSLKKHLERTRKATVSLTDGKGSGSGVIVSKDGLIMTAAHVTAEVNKPITIIMEDGTKLKGVSLGLDSNSDAALAKITEEGEYPFVEVDRNPLESITTKLGDWVYAIGHSGGFDQNRGSVVRLGRIVRLNDNPATFQSDGSLIGGDSGGPLFNMNGVLIGIHSRVGLVLDQNMHVASYDFFSKLNSDDEKTKWQRMLEGEFLGEGPFAQRPKPGSGFMGFAVKEESDTLTVTDIDKNGPAAKAGLNIGDRLMTLNGNAVKSKNDLALFIKERVAGAKVDLMVKREGSEILISFRLVTR